jgi:N-acetylglucosaminyldiphosphoundecaprenol N-acetyl-beta-D-mannosaminyltransferase
VEVALKAPAYFMLERPDADVIKRSSHVILGVPVDAITREQAVEHIFNLVEIYPSDRRPRLVCTVGAGFFSRAMGRAPHPELPSILRGADLVLAADQTLVRMIGYLGPALVEPAAGEDFLSGLAGEAAKRGKSLYILGGTPGAAQKAATALHGLFPGLSAQGADAPADAPEKEEELVEKINSASPDLLLIALGSPGQELFFGRNRHRLKVPVTVCVGDEPGFPADPASCTALERLIRTLGTPWRIWKHRILYPARLGWQVWPSALLYQYTKRTVLHAFLKKCKSGVSYKYMTRGSEQVLLFTMPGSVDVEAVPRLASIMPQRPSAHLILNVGDVAFIDSAGLGLFLSTVSLWEGSGRTVLITGITPYGKKVIATSGLSDFLDHRLCTSLDDALARLDACAGETARKTRETLIKTIL